MTRKHAELEQEFISDLTTRTGRDLAQWMAVIEAARLVDGNRLTDKNAIIDWLRPQGFTFANASWLERIYHNGGRPIYLDPPRLPGTASTGNAGRAPRLPPREPRHGAPSGSATVPPSRPMAPSPPATATPRPLPAHSDPDLIRQVLAKGKAFRPLAEYVAAEIARALPEVVVSAADDHLVFARPLPLAVLWISPRELRLGLDLGEQPFDAIVVRAKLPGSPAVFTHMIVLNDARQVGPALLALVAQADTRANPTPPAPTR